MAAARLLTTCYIENITMAFICNGEANEWLGLIGAPGGVNTANLASVT